MTRPNFYAVEQRVMAARAFLEITRAMVGDASGTLGELGARARDQVGTPEPGAAHEALEKALQLIEEAREAAGNLPEMESLELLEAVGDLSDDLDDLNRTWWGRKGIL